MSEVSKRENKMRVYEMVKGSEHDELKRCLGFWFTTKWAPITENYFDFLCVIFLIWKRNVKFLSQELIASIK